MANSQNTTAAIMAIPTDLDPIRLVGDEDKHATLLFFGETSTLPNDAKSTLTDAVEQASTMLFPFSETVVDVSRLGPESPPALVAMLTQENLSQVRNLFMMNPSIKGYLDNVAQYPKFTPHVTLGYPDYTDEAILRTLMKQIYRVRFDRLAVWWNDERIEFPLASDSDSEKSMAMSDAIGTFLEHHGVKGQKWGVTKSRTSSGKLDAASGAKQAKTILVDKLYAQRSAKIAGLSVLGLGAAALAPGILPASAVLAAGGPAVLSGKIALASTVATRAAYVHNYASFAKREKARSRTVSHADASEETVAQVYNALTPSKKTAADLLIDASSKGIEFKDNDVIQSGWASMTPTERSVVLFLASGASSDMAHSADDTIDEFLAHHGIKGMKWGVRRAVNASTGLVSRTGSADQIAQDRINKKIKSGGIESLSNADIQAYTRRLQLQQDLSKALATQSAQQQKKADGFIKSFVKSQGNRQLDRVVNKAIDVSVEAALKQAGVKIGKKNPELGMGVQEVAKRLAPKKK